MKSLGVISRNAQLIKVTYQPSLTDGRSYHAELSTERTISHPGQGKLAYGSGKGLWMFLLPAAVQTQLALVKIGSSVKGKGLALSTSGGELLPVSSREVLHWFPGTVNIWHMQPAARLPVGFSLNCTHV